LCRCNVQRCSACGNHSGLIVKTIPGCCEKPFAFPPESCSPSLPNAFHVHPGIAFTLPRNPHEAAKAVLGYAFEALEERQVLACTRPDNERSIRVIQRLGFEPIGECGDEAGYTCNLYSLLAKLRSE
jgi:hypothetical protein